MSTRNGVFGRMTAKDWTHGEWSWISLRSIFL